MAITILRCGHLHRHRARPVDDDPAVYVFYCDPDSNVITDTLHHDLADAAEQAASELKAWTRNVPLA